MSKELCRADLGYFAAPDGTPRYGVFCPGSSAAAGGKAAVLLCPPLFEERKSAYAALAALARATSAQGHGVLRFDYRGSGESGGDASTRRWRDLGEDLAAAAGLARKLARQEALVLIGVRLGATLALLEAQKTAPCALLAIAPLARGASQLRYWRLRAKLRAELTRGGPEQASMAAPPANAGEPCDLDGFPVAPGFFDDVAEIDLLERPPTLPCPTTILQVSPRATPNADTQRLCQALGPHAHSRCLVLPPFWEPHEDLDTTALNHAVLETLSDNARA